LAEDRLAAAEGRVRALADRFPGSLPALGLAAARRGLRSVGDVRLGSGAPVLVRLDPTPTIAVGRSAWGLSGLLPGATELIIGPDDTLPAVPADRELVVVARDATRVGWVGRALAGLLAARPDAVVVEMGLPGPVPPARGWIATGGASAASARAAAELLLGTTPR
jgi:beta-N-acetylhexosaminidase